MAHDFKKPLSSFVLETLAGETVQLGSLMRQATLFVNVASKCGKTDRYYRQLQNLYLDFGGSLQIVAFPCNQFGSQERGSHEDISRFVTQKYEVTFPVMAKTEVNG